MSRRSLGLNMAGYVIRRLLQVPVTVAIILVITFFLIHAVPGDPAIVIAGAEAHPTEIEAVRQAYGLDQPLGVQFVTYATKILRGDLGTSYTLGRPVARVILDFARPTLLLTASALVVSLLGGILLGFAAARRPASALDKGINGAALLAYSLPGFWVAQLFILYLVLRLGLFPLLGYSEFGTGAPTGVGHLIDVAHHLVLPVTVLALTEVAALTRVVRAGLLEELNQAYVNTARAKGVPPDRVISAHAFRNVLLPVTTLIGTRVGFLVSGAIVVESIFSWPGIGGLVRGAARSNDLPLMLGVLLVISVAVTVTNVVTDLVYGWIDPRVRLG